RRQQHREATGQDGEQGQHAGGDADPRMRYVPLLEVVLVLVVVATAAVVVVVIVVAGHAETPWTPGRQGLTGAAVARFRAGGARPPPRPVGGRRPRAGPPPPPAGGRRPPAP